MKFGWEDTFGFSVRRIWLLRLIRNTLCIHVHGWSLRTEGKRMECVLKGGRRERKSTTLRVPAVARFSFFCFALATDFLALRYNHLESYETILAARSDNIYSIACPCNFISQILPSLLERNAFFMRTHNLKCKSKNVKIYRLQFAAVKLVLVVK